MTRNAMPASSPTSKSVQMFGWASREMVRASVEAFAELRVGGQRLRKHLDRDGAIEARVSPFVHLAHTARANLRGNFIDAEACAGWEGQTLAVNYMGGTAAPLFLHWHSPATTRDRRTQDVSPDLGAGALMRLIS